MSALGEPEWARPYVTLQCPLCGTRFPAAVNKSPGVEREQRCQRCLINEIANLTRKLAEGR
jgi:predicted Zn finger-like uncharacterized protein